MGAQKVSLSLILLLSIIGARTVAAQCGSCMENMGYCIDETKFHICPSGAQGNPITSSINSCSADEVCTSAAGICVKRDLAPANTIVCGNKCAKCPAATEIHKAMTCVSATQFALCSNNDLTSVVGNCNPGEFCNVDHYIKHGSICVPECVLSYYDYKQTCLNNVATTTMAPTVSTPAPNIDDLRKQCTDNKPANLQQGGYYYVKNKNDPNCKSFIYCEDNKGQMETILMNCKLGFFDSVTKNCVPQKPASCTVQQPQSPKEATTERTTPLPEVIENPAPEETSNPVNIPAVAIATISPEPVITPETVITDPGASE